MNIQLENIDKVSARVTLNVEENDYQPEVTKELKHICKVATIPGFRKGKAPFGMIAKLYTTEVKVKKVDELVGKSLYGYLGENKINVLGHPVISTEQKEQNIEKDKDFTFVFDVALAPEFSVELTKEDKITYYKIDITDEVIDNRVKEYASRGGSHKSIETYEDNAIIRGLLAELDETGNTKEGGLQIEVASIMPKYMKKADEFTNCKVNDVIVFSPWEAYEGNETEVASLLRIKKEEASNYQGKFSYQINEISQFVPAEVNQELFDKVYGKDTIKTEEEFRNKIKEEIAEQYDTDADQKIWLDAKTYLQEKVGKFDYAEDILKRVIKSGNPEKSDKDIEDNFEKSLNELSWELIKNKLASEYQIKVEQSDIKEIAKEFIRFQMLQYGIPSLADELIERYAEDVLKDQQQAENLANQALTLKLIKVLKEKVTLEEKAISYEDFCKFFA